MDGTDSRIREKTCPEPVEGFVDGRGLAMSSREWKKYKLGELGKLARGKSKHRPRDAAFLYGGTYPFIQTGDIKSADHRIYKYSQTYSEAGLAQSKLWQEGTIAITIAANIADTGILTFPACFPDSVLGFVADKGKCDIDFMEYLLQHYKKQIQSHAVGSVQDNINLGTFENVEFDLPPLPTQRRIADILSALDEKIELNRQTNATLEALAQSIFREWFVEFRYPDPNKKDPKGLRRNQASSQAKESGENGSSQAGQTFRVSNLPQGWRVVALDKIADFLNGLALQKFPAENENDYLPVIKIRELKNGVTNSTDKASRNIPSKYVVHDGDLIFSWSGTLEVKFWVGGKGALNQHLFKVTSEEYPLWFCYFWILHHIDKFRGIAADKTTTMGHIQRHHLSEALCVVPDDLSQMDKVLRPLIEQMINLEQQSATLATLRDALLPKLMSGEVVV